MLKNFNEISLCEVCGCSKLLKVLDLGVHPMCDDLVEIGSKRVCKEYPIEILFCRICNTAHQRFQVPKEDLFPSSYHYRSRFTNDVLIGMENLVDSCIKRFGNLLNKKVLDIGCNDGSLLDYFRIQGAITFGIEPTDACLDARKKEHVVYKNYLSENIANTFVSEFGKPDIITFTNVFAHIENLQEVLGSIRILMAPNTKIVIENHYLGSVLDGNQFDTFYHEHPRTYSYSSFIFMAKNLDTELFDVEFPSRYGGNIRVFMGDIPKNTYTPSLNLDLLSIRENKFFDDFYRLRKNLESWKNYKQLFFRDQFKKYGKLRAKAFPGRAAILVKLLDLDECLIHAVYEKPGSLKVGHYLPGTRIPILSDDLLFLELDLDRPIVNLAWHISFEIQNYLAEKGYTGPVFDILSFDDFPN